MGFEDQHEEMGLDKKADGTFYYADRYGEVVYKQLITKGDSGLLDDVELPYFALYTKGISQDEEFMYNGNLSHSYQFIGNDAINEQIRNSIAENGTPIFLEKPLFNREKSRMYNQIIIQHEMNVPQAGDVYPMIVVKNSYNGSMSASISFGLHMSQDNNDVVFSFNMGEMKQIHLQNIDTRLRASVGTYINSFTENITSLFRDNFNNLLTEDDVLGVLDLVEEVGKKRKETISNILTELVGDRENGIAGWGISSFNLFLAITKYSTTEKNLNAKKLLENVAERVLVVPPQLLALLEN